MIRLTILATCLYSKPNAYQSSTEAACGKIASELGANNSTVAYYLLDFQHDLDVLDPPCVLVTAPQITLMRVPLISFWARYTYATFL
jgi:hypothetical protein